MSTSAAPASRSSLWSRVNLAWSLALTVLFEAVTCLFRFGLKMQSTRDTASLRHWTFGLRIHHGYVGVLLVCAALLVSSRRGLRHWLLRIGVALILSDLAHHFLVLLPITGDAHFDFVYPQR